MQITRISVYQADLPVRGGGFRQSSGRIWRVLDTSVVRMETDAGVTGWGETCPFGANYVPAFAEGARAGMEFLAPLLIGKDPCDVAAINLLMDTEMYGIPFAKAGLDNACWDILGQSAGMPVYMLLGGRLTDPFPFGGGFVIDPGPATDEAMTRHKERGARQFEFKGSGDPATDIEMIQYVGDRMETGDSLIIDVNCGYRVDEAIRVSRAVPDVDVIFEQPCYTYEECLAFKRSTGRPMSLDECIHDTADLVRAYSDQAIDTLNLKIGRIGGISKSRVMRDLCVSLGIPVKVQDTSGEEFNAAATAHLAHSTPPRYLRSMWDCAGFVERPIGKGLLRDYPNQARANTEPGFGVTPIMEEFGDPVAVYE